MKHDWEYKKLGEVCDFERGLTYSKDDESSSPTRNIVFRSNNVDLETKRIVWDDLKYLVSNYNIPKSKMVKPQTILMCMSNGSMQHVGKVAYIDKKYDVAFGGFMGLIIPKSNCYPKYLFYFLNSPTYRHFLLSIANGINITNLKFSDLRNLNLPIPPLAIQEQIVAELDKVSEIIEKKKQQVKELDNLAQSIFYDMFGDPVENEKGWEVKKMNEVGEIVAGSTPSTADNENWDGEINWVTPAELGSQLYYGETQRKLTEKGARGLAMMPVGTVLLSSRAPIGKLAITTVEMCCNQGFKNIVCKDVVNNIFLYHYLLYTIEEVKSLGVGATFKEVSKKAISAYKVILPPLSLQQSFAKKIEAIEKQKELITASIKEMQTLFDSRMEYYFG